MKTTPWLPVPDGPHACMRCLAGTDGTNVADRVALIEKTPRVRIRREASTRDCHPDWLNWAEAPFSGPGCSGDQDPATEEAYGYHLPSRAWCDAALRLLDYDLG